MRRLNPAGTGIFDAMRKFVLLILVGICGLASGCKGSQTIWSAQAKSPDGKMIASARTVAQSGFGTGYIGTVVYLNWINGSQRPMEILGLSSRTEATGTTHVEMKWLTPMHLELTYKGQQDVDFQAVKCDDIDITVRDLSSGTIGAYQ